MVSHMHNVGERSVETSTVRQRSVLPGFVTVTTHIKSGNQSQSHTQKSWVGLFNWICGAA